LNVKSEQRNVKRFSVD